MTAGPSSAGSGRTTALPSSRRWRRPCRASAARPSASTAQAAHVDLQKPATGKTIRDALNFHLRPWPVAVLAAEAAPEDFHARLSAIGRSYLYRIVNRRPPPTLEAGRVWHVLRPLDAEAMDAAAQLLVGRHDFSTFRASLCQAKSPVKTLDLLEVRRDGAEIRITARARSFL